MTILGTPGNDTLTNTTGAPDTIDGLGGNDSIVGSFSNPNGASDLVLGGDGNDTLLGAATLYGGGGDDSIQVASGFADGGDGADRILFVDIVGAATILGGGGDDVIDGASYYYTVFARNLFSGGDGDDTLIGGQGVDTLIGGAGDDYLVDVGGTLFPEGEPGYQDGGEGQDTLQTGDYHSGWTLTGGEDSDLFILSQSGDSAADVITDFQAGSGGDTVQLPPYSGAGLRQHGSDVYWGLPTLPMIVFENTTITDFIASNFADGLLPAYQAGRITGTGDSDFVDLFTDSAGVAGGSATPTHDTISALQGADTVDANAGNDQVWAGSGNDSVMGQAGADTLGGAEGDDTILGGADADQLMGSEGEDRLYGGEGADTLSGGTGSDVLIGGEGDDVLYAGTDAAGDSIDGGAGNDSAYGSAGADLMDLGTGADLARGGAGDDTLLGGAGSDTLFGGAGSDLLSGGADGDVFQLAQDAGAVDVILDFSGGASGEGDRLLVSSSATRDALIASATGDASQTELSARGITVVLVGVDVGTVSTDWFLVA